MAEQLQTIVNILEAWGTEALWDPFAGTIDVDVDEHTTWYFGTADGENWGAQLITDEGEVLEWIDNIGVNADETQETEIAAKILNVIK